MKQNIFLTILLLLTGFGICATNGVEALDEGERVLTRLKQEPTDVVAIKQLPGLFAAAMNDDVKGVLCATYSLACLGFGNVENATKATQALAKQCPDSPYLNRLKFGLYLDACPDCLGKGTVLIECPQCHGGGKCNGCKGSRTIETFAAQWTFGQPRPHNTVQCPTCKGTGLCKKCGGVGQINDKCSKCTGSGQVFSAELAKKGYIAFLDLAIPVVHAQSMVAKGLITFEGQEVTPGQRDAIIALRQAQVAADLAEADRKAAEARKRQAEGMSQGLLKLVAASA